MKLNTILLNLYPTPPQGQHGVIPRLSLEDRNMVNDAARALNMSQAKFMRTVLVNAARKVLDELGSQDI